MADKKLKTVTIEDRNDQSITATLVEGKDKGLLLFIPGDFSKPDGLDDMGRVKKIVSTENWMTFKGFMKGWDLVGGIHFGLAKPREKKS